MAGKESEATRGATAAENPLVASHHLRAVLATAKGLCVCVCFLRPHNPDELASKPHVNRLTTASVSTLSPVLSEGLVAMLGP